MANGPRNLALPAILAVGIVVASLTLFSLRDRGLPVAPTQEPPTHDAPAEASGTPVDDAPAGDSRGGIDAPATSPEPPGGGPPRSSAPPLDVKPPTSRAGEGDPAVAARAGGGASGRREIGGDAAGGNDRTRETTGVVGTSAPGGASAHGAGGRATDAEGATPLTIFAERPPAGAGASAGAPDVGAPDVGAGAVGAQARESDVEAEAGGERDEPTGTPERRADTGDAATVSTPHVFMVAESSEVFVGDPVTIHVQISGGADVGHVPFHVTFDPRVVRFEQGEEGFYLGQDGNQTAFFAAPTSDGSAVVVGLSRLGRVKGVAGAGDLCTLVFTATGPGNVAFAFARAKVRDSSNRIVPAVFQPAAVTVRE